MPSTYSPNLRIELIANGEQSGTWGTTTNVNLGTLIEDAIAGYVSVSVTSANQALTALDGAADQSRNMVLNLTTTTAAPFNVYIPPAEKFYVVRNDSAYGATIYCSTVLGNTTAAGLGVTVLANSTTIIFSDGTNVRVAIDSFSGSSLVAANLTVNGNTTLGDAVGDTVTVNGATTFVNAAPTLTPLTASQAVFTNGSKTLVSNAITGTGNVVMSNSPTLVTPALGTPSSGTVTNLTGTASININGTVGATTPAAGTFTSLSDSGNLTFTGTGNRITGDFSNATKTSRVSFQSSTTDGTTVVQLIPNGTSTSAQFAAYGGSDIDNTSVGQLTNNGTEVRVASGIFGTGTYLPMTFYTGGTEVMRIDTSGNVGIGTSSPLSKLEFNGGAANTYLRIVDTRATYPTYIGAEQGATVFGRWGLGESMRIDSSGNVLIGSSTANAKLYSYATSGTTTTLGRFEAAIGSYTGTSLIAANTLDASSSFNLFSCITDSDGDSGGPVTEFLVRGDGNVGIGTTDTSLFNSVGGSTRLAVCGSSASTDILGNTGASISIINTDTTANNTAGLHFARADTDDTPNYAGASIVAQFPDTQVANQYPKGLLAFLTSTTANQAPSEKMRIDSSGNVGIGTSAPRARLDLANGVLTGVGNIGGQADTSAYSIWGGHSTLNGAYIQLWGASSASANLLIFGNASTERARIDSSGNFMLGTTSLISGSERFAMNYQSNSGPGLVIQDTTPQNGNTFIRFVNAGTIGGAIISNGGTSMTYGSASDYRLKENLTPLTGALAKVAALQPKVGNWKVDGSEFVGFLAHELQEVFPDAVVGEKDRVDADGNPLHQMVDTGSASIIATLAAAIQEQQQMIETLQAEVAALKGA